MTFFAAVLVATAVVGVAQEAPNDDAPLIFEDWRMHFMQPPSRIDEIDVTVWLSPDGRMAITNPDRHGSQYLRNRSLPWFGYEAYLVIDLTDVYEWGSIGVRDGFFDKRPLIRIKYRNQEGGLQYVLLGFPAGDRDDDFRFAVFESELEISTGLTNGEFGGLSDK
jgi:hypothetical protein